MPPVWVFKLAGKLAGIAILALAAYGVYWSIDNSGYNRGVGEVQTRWDKAEAERASAQDKKDADDFAKLRKLEGTKNENLAEIDRLRANNHALWLRLPKTACGGSGQSGSDNVAGDRELSTPGERYLAEAKRQLDDEAERADKIVEECRVLNDGL
jgi:hypothetical protein